jgi:hypothetical protein
VGRNPLRRRIDRVEGGHGRRADRGLLTGAPVAVAGHWTRAAGIRQQRAELAWRQVPAAISRSPAAQRDGFPGRPATGWESARWTAPDGQARTGWIPVSPGPAGRTLIWVSHSGSLTGPPLQRRQLQKRMVLAGALTASVLGLMCFLAGGAGRFVLGRRRLADWDRAWRAVGPRWTRQL